MDESEFLSEYLLPKFDDPESPDRRERTPHPFDTNDHLEQPSTKPNPHDHIYSKYFTPAERELLEAIPENDVSYEINFMRYLLEKTFAMVPADPYDKKHAIPFQFRLDMITVVHRSVIVLARLVALHNKMNNSRAAWSALIKETLDEMDPHNLDYYVDVDDDEDDLRPNLGSCLAGSPGA